RERLETKGPRRPPLRAIYNVVFGKWSGTEVKIDSEEMMIKRNPTSLGDHRPRRCRWHQELTDLRRPPVSQTRCPLATRARCALADPYLEPLDKLVLTDRRGRPLFAIGPRTRMK